MQTFNNPITHNPLLTREDFKDSLIQILDPCKKSLINGNSGLFIGNTMASYSSRGSLLEGWSRLLWGLAPLSAGGFEWNGQKSHREGLINGTDPKSPYYWGDMKDMDQRMVETAAIATSLLLSPSFYWEPLTEVQKNNLITWLDSVNRNKFPQCNWLFFRVLVNLSFKKLGRNEFNNKNLENDLNVIDSWYIDDGWYIDEVQFDNYNNWAFQYYNALYYSLMKDEDIERCKIIKERLFKFATQIINYYSDDGIFIPYGRSLTYKIADVSFLCACAYAGLEVIPYGVMKGIILRNLRWWFKQPIFDRDGLLTIGYVNPTLLMMDQYNGQATSYWGLKVYILLSLPKDHPFWTAEELPMMKIPSPNLLKIPHALFMRTSDGDDVMLNGGQYPDCLHLHIAEKYAKFAYSANYAFSTSVSYYDFKNTGCDSMLYVSKDNNNYWFPRRESEILFQSNEFIVSKWSPFRDVVIITYLIPVEDYHVRVHKISTESDILLKEGGFSIEKYRGIEIETDPICEQDNQSSLGIKMPWDISVIEDPLEEANCEMVSPNANLNLNFSTTLVPVLNRKMKKNTSKVLVTIVGASSDTKKFYQKRPQATLTDNASLIINGKKVINLIY
jgi:hypothetical protein